MIWGYVLGKKYPHKIPNQLLICIPHGLLQCSCSFVSDICSALESFEMPACIHRYLRNALFGRIQPVKVLACQPPKCKGGTGWQIDAEFPRRLGRLTSTQLGARAQVRTVRLCHLGLEHVLEHVLVLFVAMGCNGHQVQSYCMALTLRSFERSLARLAPLNEKMYSARQQVAECWKGRPLEDWTIVALFSWILFTGLV